jgi:transcriptional regulator
LYLPRRFENTDVEKSLEVIRAAPLATLISQNAQLEPFISHIPLVAVQEGETIVLYGHLAKANPHAQLLQDKKIYAIFHGPEAYITPRWYTEHDVPTWNYAVVHIQGQVQELPDRAGVLQCLEKLTAHVDPEWRFELPEDLQAPERFIVGFRITVESMKSKFKMGQNRSAADQKGVIHGLEKNGDDRSLAVMEYMKRNLL